jgi:hypothetical protein
MDTSRKQAPTIPYAMPGDGLFHWLIAGLCIFSVGCSIGIYTIGPIGMFIRQHMIVCTPVSGGCVAPYTLAERLSTLAGGMVGGSVVALVAGLYLRRYLARHLLGWWIISNIAGMASGLGLTYHLNLLLPDDNTLAFAATAALGGSVLGAAQWVLLRRRLPQAYWWIAAVSGAWAILAFLLLSIVLSTD